jgi:5-methylcytosine-specific restriction endonuclease McrA
MAIEKAQLRAIAKAWKVAKVKPVKVKEVRYCLSCGSECLKVWKDYCSTHCKRIHTNEVVECSFIWFKCANCLSPSLRIFKKSNPSIKPFNMFCSKSCSHAKCNYGGRKIRRQRIRDAKKGFKSFSKLDVFQKSLGCCGICGMEVDSAIKYPHPMSASIDHIIPIAKGGNHCLSNVQLAHFICNSHKQDLVY